MRCPTFTFKNNQTGETIVINQSDYLQDRYKHITRLDNLNSWERVSETSGDAGGFEVSKGNSDIAIMLVDKRAKDNLGKKIKFA